MPQETPCEGTASTHSQSSRRTSWQDCAFQPSTVPSGVRVGLLRNKPRAALPNRYLSAIRRCLPRYKRNSLLLSSNKTVSWHAIKIVREDFAKGVSKHCVKSVRDSELFWSAFSTIRTIFTQRKRWKNPRKSVQKLLR